MTYTPSHRRHIRKYYKNRISNGLCAKCGKENDRVGLANCSICAEYYREYYKKRYERLKWHTKSLIG